MPNEFIEFDPKIPDENRGQTLFTISMVYTICIIVSSTLRVFVRLSNRMGLVAADYFSIICLAFNLGANILEIQAVNRGFGRHIQWLSSEQVLYLREKLLYATCLSTIALWAVKISICFFILALIQNAHQRIRWFVYLLIAVGTVGTTATVIIWSLQASPLEKLWKPEIPGTIANPKIWVIAAVVQTALNTVTDLFYALSPIYFVGKLQMSLRRKITVLALTGSGLLVFAASLGRLIFYKGFLSKDFSWDFYNIWVCTITERNMAEFIADLPACYSLFRDIGRRCRRGSQDYKSARHGFHRHRLQDSGEDSRQGAGELPSFSLELSSQYEGRTK